MKKKMLIIVISCAIMIIITLLIIHIINNSSIYVTKEMQSEDGEIESAWDFQENLNMGWNLGMSLSANIQYPKIIKYKLISQNDTKLVSSELFECDVDNNYYIPIQAINSLKLEFDIPYTSLDGILTWEIQNISFNNETKIANKNYKNNVTNGKLIVPLDIDNTSQIEQISINIKVHSFYEENTLEKVNFYETFWCENKTTKQLFQTLKNKGFNAIRISFDVYNHINEDGIIDDMWLNRLKEIVDYCIDLDMYCLVDIVETYGLYVDDINEKSLNLFISLWKQVANVFTTYNGYLLFSPFNEIRNLNGDWNTTSKKELDNMNYLYQVFVDTIRSTGGYNRERNLILTTYASSFTDLILENFKLPKDITKNHLLIECHNYQPVRFTFNEINLGSTDFLTEWGSLKDKKEMKKIFKTFNSFIKKTKVPLIIGEFGVVDRISTEERVEYLNFYIKQAKKYKICLFIFDDSHDFAIIDRKTYQFINQEIIDVLFKE